MSSVLARALEMADQGIPVFPVRADKRPACEHGHLDATIDHARIREMFDETGAPLVGIPAGEASGIDILDVDDRNGGDKWPGLAELPPTRTHKTRSGGRHWLFQHAQGVRNSQSKIARGIDVRGDGGYFIAWPAENDLPIAPWPADVLEAALRKPPVNPKADSLRSIARQPSTDGAKTALADAVKLIEAAQPGERYEAVKSVTWSLSKLILGGLLDEDTARDAVRDAAEAAGGEDMTKVDRLWDGALEKVEPITGGSEFDPLPPESEEPVVQPAGRRALRDRLLFPVDCDNGPRRGYIVKGLIAPGDVVAVIGHPGTGKSVIAPHLAYALAQGRPAFGMRTKAGSVLYAAAEDHSGMRQRVAALRRKHGDAPDFAMVDIGNLRNPPDAAELLDFVYASKQSLVVIDTIGAAWAGMDENSAPDMGNVVALARSLAATGTAVMLVHHLAKNGDGSPRGHSVLNGTLDACLSLAPADDGIIRAKLTKNRNGSCDLDIAFRVNVVTLALDEDGDAITAPIAGELDARSFDDRRPVKPLPASLVAPLRVLTNLIAVSGTQPVTIEAWRAACLADGEMGAGSGFRTKLTRAKSALLDLKMIEVERDSIRLVQGRIKSSGASLSDLADDAPLH